MDEALASQTRRLWYGLGITLVVVSVVVLVVLPTIVSLDVIKLESNVLYMICGLVGALFLLGIVLIWRNYKRSKYELI